MSKENRYKHFVITRFNIRVNFECKLKNPTDNPMKRILDKYYLQERFRIFEEYTLKSMKQQTNQNFTWLVLFHKDTPNYFKNKIEELKKEFHFVDLYFGDDEKFDFLKYCNNEKETKYVISTRIDNDDILSKDHIGKIQEYANNNLHECIISFNKGSKYDLISKKLYEYEREDNHFLSMISQKKECILKYNHSKIFSSGEQVVILNSNKPMWTEIVHQSNVINTIKYKDKEMKSNNLGDMA